VSWNSNGDRDWLHFCHEQDPLKNDDRWSEGPKKLFALHQALLGAHKNSITWIRQGAVYAMDMNLGNTHS